MKGSRLFLVQDDITKLKTDAIVNAANRTLLGGGGVDGAIHRAAGPELLAECRLLNGCETGDAKITKAYRLPAKFVIHTVGPVWRGGTHQEEALLASCYQKSLELAAAKHCHDIAFPNISTGIYRFPKRLAAQIAIRTVFDFLSHHPIPQKVYFVCFDEENYNLYKQLLEPGAFKAD
jgi:O-acetyl-ADP-ribose deacetylase (regulator of RNase III)